MPACHSEGSDSSLALRVTGRSEDRLEERSAFFLVSLRANVGRGSRNMSTCRFERSDSSLALRVKYGVPLSRRRSGEMGEGPGVRELEGESAHRRLAVAAARN